MGHTLDREKRKCTALNAVAITSFSERNFAMSFKFKITKIDALRHAGVGVFDGQILTGKILTGQDVFLVHKDKKLPLQVAGVVMQNRKSWLKDADTLSLSFKLRDKSFEYAQVGDVLIAA